ncbi:hypothetical protein GQ55_5G509400 [Panicum hallii var. hallii]|uniref:Uncharacterized protein n=1 Tax=Panicum hallii var. hallii TaxID=1504633 RepID=A0A2T7DS78_9POAL|nr:hypothetical protein GQ55_5G509400 [Panicum hallii var. hallii]
MSSVVQAYLVRGDVGGGALRPVRVRVRVRCSQLQHEPSIWHSQVSLAFSMPCCVAPACSSSRLDCGVWLMEDHS